MTTNDGDSIIDEMMQSDMYHASERDEHLERRALLEVGFLLLRNPYIYIYVCMYVYIYMHIYIYIYIWYHIFSSASSSSLVVVVVVVVVHLVVECLFYQ